MTLSEILVGVLWVSYCITTITVLEKLKTLEIEYRKRKISGGMNNVR